MEMGRTFLFFKVFGIVDEVGEELAVELAVEEEEGGGEGWRRRCGGGGGVVGEGGVGGG